MNNIIDFATLLIDDSLNYYFITDANTKEILYINQAMCDYINVQSSECLNRKCYDVLYDLKFPYDFCINDSLLSSQIKTVETIAPLNGYNFKCKISIFNYNERLVHISKYWVDTKTEYTKNLNVENTNSPLYHHLMKDLHDNNFVVYLQPKVRLSDNKVVGAEALVRKFNYDDNMLILPSEFIPFYENEFIVKHIDLFVLSKVCKRLAQWIKIGHTLEVSVNFSRITLIDDDIVSKIKDICDDNKIRYDLINIGVTDGLHRKSDDDTVKNVIDKLANLGFNITIDDFSYINTHSLPNTKTTVNIDKDLINNIENDDKKQLIVKNLIDVYSKIVNTTTIAVGIETTSQEELVKQLLPTYGQGFLYSRPIPMDEFFDRFISD